MGNARGPKLVSLVVIGLVVAALSAGGGDEIAAAQATAATRPATTRAATLYERLQACPVMVGPFMKVGVRRYDDPAGEDVSVGYNFFRGLAHTSIACTVYFYPLPDAKDAGALAKHREQVLGEIAAAHATARVVSSGEAVVRQGGKECSGEKVVLEYDGPFGTKGEVRALRSELYLFRRGAQVVKYRITCPANEAGEGAGRIERFLAEFEWPEA